MKPVQAGKFRQRVALQDLVETTDSYGQPVQSWVDVARVWAEVRPLRGSELLNVKQNWATASHFVNHRYLGSTVPNPKQRYLLIKDGRIMNILNVNNIEERNRSYEATCEEYIQ
jgi:SPP1 family predicted phage head-tail adaptor